MFQRPNSRASAVLLVCAAAQCVVLVIGRPTLTSGDWAAALALALVAGLYIRRPRRIVVDMVMTTAFVGGLGMLVGSLIDAGIVRAEADALAALPPCHRALATDSGTGSGAMAYVNWMTGLMLVTCIPSCLLLSCPWRRVSACSSSRRWLGHLLCTLGMLVGMYLGGYVLFSPLSVPFGEFAGMHLAMVAGMAAGVCLSWPLACHVAPLPSVEAHR